MERKTKKEKAFYGRNDRAITLIALTVTIIVLALIVTITINTMLNNNGLINRASKTVEETKRQAATEKMNLKITNIQISGYAEKHELPTLQYLSDKLCEDDDMEYVVLKDKDRASLEKISVGETDSILTKLKEYPYEFEINNSLQLESIDGIKIAKEDENKEIKTSNFIVYLDGKLIDEIPSKEEGYRFIGCECTEGASCSFDTAEWKLGIDNITSAKTTCTIRFSSQTVSRELVEHYSMNLSDIFSNPTIVAEICENPIWMRDIVEDTILKEYMYENASIWETAISSSNTAKNVLSESSQKKLVSVWGRDSYNYAVKTLYNKKALVLYYSFDGASQENWAYIGTFINGNSNLTMDVNQCHSSTPTYPIFKFASSVSAWRGNQTATTNYYYAYIIPIEENN